MNLYTYLALTVGTSELHHIQLFRWKLNKNLAATVSLKPFKYRKKITVQKKELETLRKNC